MVDEKASKSLRVDGIDITSLTYIERLNKCMLKLNAKVRRATIVFQKQEVLKKKRERLNVFFMFNGCIHWRYQPPLWVFPPLT